MSDLPRAEIKPKRKLQNRGVSKMREYIIWCHIKSRCYNKNNNRYYTYGGRGITIYEPWIKDFWAFYVHVGPRPTPKHQIDRIDNDGPYAPGNIRWVTLKENRQNRGNLCLIEYKGDKRNISEWAIHLRIKVATLRFRLKSGWSVERAFTRPTNCLRDDQKERVWTFDGNTMHLKKWAELKNIPYKTLVKRWSHGWTAERALTQPIRASVKGANF